VKQSRAKAPKRGRQSPIGPRPGRKPVGGAGVATGTLRLRVPEPILRAIQEQAERRGITVSEVVREVLEHQFSEEDAA